MANIAFIGVGNMGGPMAANLVKGGHAVTAFDLIEANLNAAVEAGCTAAASTAEAVKAADIVITMLPAGKHVKAVYGGDICGNARPGSLFIDCSTIDVATAREVAASAAEQGFTMIDAPVSGGVGGAAAGTLTFMVGGEEATVKDATPYLEIMGAKIVHCGGSGNGQAAKACNNMMLGIQMASVCEGFALAEKLGLAHDKLFAVSSAASGQCWSLTSYCPVPGPVETSPANNDYKPGFGAPLMLKDMMLALAAGEETGTSLAVAKQAAAIYQAYVDGDGADKDFSGIIEYIRAQ